MNVPSFHNSFQLQSGTPPPSRCAISPDRREVIRRSLIELRGGTFSVLNVSSDHHGCNKRWSLILRRDLGGRIAIRGQTMFSQSVHQGIDCLIKFLPFIQGAVVHRRARKNVFIEPLLVGGGGADLIDVTNIQPVTKFHINYNSHLGFSQSLVSSFKTETNERYFFDEKKTFAATAKI